MEERTVAFMDTGDAAGDGAKIRTVAQSFIDGLRAQDARVLGSVIADDAVLDSYFAPHPTSKAEFIEKAIAKEHAKYLQHLRYIAVSITDKGESIAVEGLLEGRLPDDPAPTYHRTYRLTLKRDRGYRIVKGEYCSSRVHIQ